MPNPKGTHHAFLKTLPVIPNDPIIFSFKIYNYIKKEKCSWETFKTSKRKHHDG